MTTGDDLGDGQQATGTQDISMETQRTSSSATPNSQTS